MKLRSIVLATTSALLMGWILFGKKQSAARKQQSRKEAADRAALDDAASSATYKSDADALSALSAVNAHAVGSADLIQAAKGLSEPVQRYARMLHAQHTDSQRQLQELARSEGVAISDLNPKVVQLKSNGRGEREKLGTLQGDELELAYLDATIASHQSVLDLIDNDLLPATARAEVDRHLRETREHFATHLEKGKQLRESLVAS